MAGSLGRLNGRVTLWLARCAAFVLALLAILTFIDVVGRYAFSRSLSATVELTELGMGLIVYLSVGLVTHQRGNVAVDFVTIRLPKSLQSALDAAVQLIALGYLGVLVWRLFLSSSLLRMRTDLGVTSRISSLWMYACSIRPQRGQEGLHVQGGTLAEWWAGCPLALPRGAIKASSNTST